MQVPGRVDADLQYVNVLILNLDPGALKQTRKCSSLAFA